MKVKEMMHLCGNDDYVIRVSKDKEYLCMYGFDVNGKEVECNDKWVSHFQIPEDVEELEVTAVFSEARQYKMYGYHDHDYSLVVIKAY